MISRVSAVSCLIALVFFSVPLSTARADSPAGQKILMGVLNQILPVIAPKDGAGKTLSASVKVLRATGLPKQAIGPEVELAFEAPDRLRLSATVGEDSYMVGRHQNTLWMHAPSKSFGVIGKPGVQRFRASPSDLDKTTLPDFKLALPPEQLILLPVLCSADEGPSETVQGVECHALRLRPRPEAAKFVKLPDITLYLWVRKSDYMPLIIAYQDEKGTDVAVELIDPKVETSWPKERWLPPAENQAEMETVALGHLTRFISAAISGLGQTLPELGLATGKRRVIARHGEGRLEERDGTRVLFLKGTPEQMGAQHGTLMKKEVHHLVERILYGVGVGSSLGKGRWFFGEIEDAQARLQPFVDRRHLREMDALAKAAGVRVQEARLANLFPELFHCSGFALLGKATQGGRLFHGRVLDYLKGVGLEQNAVVMVMQPDEGHAWVNVGYAGFLGTVTAMNEQQIAIGEMGGRGEGHWDGKPMAQLMREVMEKAATIDEAVEIMRQAPRTCEYYYVISDAKTMRAVGIAATPERFETVWTGESHPQLPHPIEDTVLLSAGDRYETLVQRVRDGFGQFDEASARDLMTRPVCMNSNIQSVLFAPDTLDFWVANADGKNVASHTRYTQYNLKELLQPEKKTAAK